MLLKAKKMSDEREIGKLLQGSLEGPLRAAAVAGHSFYALALPGPFTIASSAIPPSTLNASSAATQSLMRTHDRGPPADPFNLLNLAIHRPLPYPAVPPPARRALQGPTHRMLGRFLRARKALG